VTGHDINPALHFTFTYGVLVSERELDWTGSSGAGDLFPYGRYVC